MMKKHFILGIGAVMVVSSFTLPELAFTSELDDGMGKYTDENIKKDDEALKLDTNTSFIIVDAISASQSGRKNTNFNDDDGENNENSIVVGPGTQTGDIINVIIERK